MKKLILATASVLALGMAASGASFAHQPANSAQLPQGSQSSMNQPSQSSNAMTQGNGPTASMQGAHSNRPVRLSRDQVKKLQQALKSAGLYKGRIDGKNGPQTRHAIAQFQKQNGMRATGHVTRQTLAALNNTNSGNSGVGVGSSMNQNPQPSNAGVSDGLGNTNSQPSMTPDSNASGSTPNQTGTTNPNQPGNDK